MTRAVVDTNILIRALIKPHGTVGPILTWLTVRIVMPGFFLRVL